MSPSTVIYKVPKKINPKLTKKNKKNNEPDRDERTVAEENSPLGRKHEQTQAGRQPSAVQPKFGLVMKKPVSRTQNCSSHPIQNLYEGG